MLSIEVTKNKQYNDYVVPIVRQMHKQNIIQRIWDLDHTVWKPDPTEISNRLGWLHITNEMESQLPNLFSFVDEVQQDKYTHVVLLGMGGSSLASDVFQRVFPKREGYLKLSVLDSTDPDVVLRCLRNHKLLKTLFIVATKSGSTAETLSFFKFFYTKYVGMMNSEEAGRHFIAITDPGSKLAVLAEKYHFRRTFINNPSIGGRFSVLSYFGLVPAVLMGVDVQKLLLRAKGMAVKCRSLETDENPAVLLGGTLGALALQNINKATFIASPSITAFGDWVEQLIAESTGKDGKGIVPIVDEPIGDHIGYSWDRVFIVQHLRSESVCDETYHALAKANYPVIRVKLDDIYDLGALFFLWEMATAVAGYSIGIQPFDQPNVEMAKHLARESIQQYQQTGKLDQGDYASLSVESLQHFLSNMKLGDYVSIQAYIAPSLEVDQAIKDLQVFIHRHTQLPVTRGYGPRFLHSTGQLHKGDAGDGLFIQIVSETETDLPIPDEPGQISSSMSFGVLKIAQALGDYKALCDVNRRVIRFMVRGDIPGAIRKLTL